jgi:predicted transcriptional regulator
MVKIESKEKLAKLLAMEDIDIQHQQVKTAMFDVKNRVLVLPVWKDMPNHLYDLLVGHEVGHALFTPNSEDKLKKLVKKSSMHCVNVVEDARIEALMKRKYPGLVKQFFKGYEHLIEKDFFGLSTMDIRSINLLDKINLHFKVPRAIAGIVEFNDIEQSFVDRIEKIRKFEELEKICVEICDYIKENREEDDDENSIFDEDSYTMADEENQMGDFSDEESDEEEEEEKEVESKSDEDESEDSEEVDGPEQGEEDSDENSAPNGSYNPDYKEEENDDLKSQTYENYEKNVKELADVHSEFDYVTIPESINYDNIIDYKDAYKALKEYYSVEGWIASKELDNDKINSRNSRYDWHFDDNNFEIRVGEIFKNAKMTYNKIKKESTKNVAHMAMEFERKKCADIYKRTLLTKTGVLDTNKMFSAKYNEDVFRKNVKTPEGKNHGLVIFVDWSGSMSVNMSGCIKQLIELVLFCKKVNIPFEVYSFTDVTGLSASGKTPKKRTFNYKHGDLAVDTKVTLKNYLSSRMSVKELNQAMINICVISNSFRGGYQQYPIPLEDSLGYTPLNGAILASEHLIKDFQKKNNVQEVHSVWITDGEGNETTQKWDMDKGIKGIDYSKRMVIQDKKMKKNYKVEGRRHLTNHLFKIVKDRLGCNVIGFFLDSNYGKKHIMSQYYYRSIGSMRNDDFTVWNNKAKKDGYFVKTQDGYDEYYVIGNSRKSLIPNEKFIDEKMTARKMAVVFSAKSTGFRKSRVILSRFIDLITKKL